MTITLSSLQSYVNYTLDIFFKTVLLGDVLIGCRTSMLCSQTPAFLNPASPLPETLLAASSWAPLLPRVRYDLRGGIFRRCHLARAPQRLLCWVSTPPLHTHGLGIPPFSWEGMPVTILGMFTCSLLGLVDVSLLLPSHSYSCREP